MKRTPDVPLPRMKRRLVLDTREIREASESELRVLILLMEDDTYGLAEAAGKLNMSVARIKSALALWEAADLVTYDESEYLNPPVFDDGHDTVQASEQIDSTAYNSAVTDEFSPVLTDATDEETSREVAAQIRDNSLRHLLDECQRLMNKAALSTTEVKRIVALYSQLSLSEEYILALAGYLAELGKLTATRLSNEAQKLLEKNIDTVEGLEIYLLDKRQQSDEEWEYRRLLGMLYRAPSKSEREAFARWSHTYGYSMEIVAVAYDIATKSTGRLSVSYIDKILCHWHSEGCRTVEECQQLLERERAQREAERSTGRAAKKSTQTAGSAMRYGTFDPKDALKQALRRSYGASEATTADDGGEDR